MSIMFKDIHEKTDARAAKNSVEGTDFAEIMFADNTICIILLQFDIM